MSTNQKNNNSIDENFQRDQKIKNRDNRIEGLKHILVGCAGSIAPFFLSSFPFMHERPRRMISTYMLILIGVYLFIKGIILIIRSIINR